MSRPLATFGKLLTRSLVVGAVALAALVGPLWFASMFTSIGIFPLPNDANVRFFRGTAEVNRVYEISTDGPAVPGAKWHDLAMSRGWTSPPRPRGWGFHGVHFSSGHVMGTNRAAAPDLFVPARYWILRLPLWPFVLPGVVAGALFIARWANRRQGGRRGFAVEARAPGA